MRLICHCFTLWDLKKLMSLLTLPLTNGNISGPLWQTDLQDKKYFPALRFLLLGLPQINTDQFQRSNSLCFIFCLFTKQRIANDAMKMPDSRTCLWLDQLSACGVNGAMSAALKFPHRWPVDQLTSWPWKHLINNSDINGLDNDNILRTLLLFTPPIPVDRMLYRSNGQFWWYHDNGIILPYSYVVYCHC